MIGALDCAAHQLIVNTSATKRSSDFITFLGRLDAIYGPCPGRQTSPLSLFSTMARSISARPRAPRLPRAIG